MPRTLTVHLAAAGTLLFIGGHALAAPTKTGDAADSESSDKTIAVSRTSGPIEVDGVADEPVWRQAELRDDFVEREPQLGGDPPLRTSIRIAYDDQALYVFVESEVPPDDIYVRTLRRDSFGIFDDDMVFLKVDPLLDRRTSYLVGVNADGAQIDMLVLEDGTLFVPEWDDVWEAETRETDKGYDAEFRIPFAVLGIQGEQTAMGFNINRVDVENLAKYDWKLPNPPERFNAASTFGTMTGFSGIDAQRSLGFTPFILGRTRFDEEELIIDPRQRPNLAAGADVRLQTGTASYAEASILTDFAQVEVDEVQVAQDRFPLFFPERRPFFINGLNVINFGTRGDAQLFFSRRIGLDGGEPIPLLGGVKAYGISGPVSYAVLNAQTLERRPRPGEDIDVRSPQNYTVARLRTAMSKESWVGVIGLGRADLDVDHNTHLATGLDGEIRADEGRFRIYGFAAQSYTERPAEPAVVDTMTGDIDTPAVPISTASGTSAHVSARYNTLNVQPSLSWTWSEESFDPAMGFYRRPGTGSQSVAVTGIARPTFIGLRELRLTPGADLVANADYSNTLTATYSGTFEAIWRNLMRASYTYSRQADVVQEDFELFGINVAADRYEGNLHQASFSTPERQFLFWALTAASSETFGGVTRRLANTIEFRPSKHFSLEGTYTHLFGEVGDPAQDFNFGFANGKVEVAMTRNLVFDTLLRMNLDPTAETVGGQSRLRWRYLPGSDAFIVFRTDQPVGDDPDDTREAFYELTIKVTYFVRGLLGF